MCTLVARIFSAVFLHCCMCASENMAESPDSDVHVPSPNLENYPHRTLIVPV